MSDKSVAAAEFSRNFGRYQDQALATGVVRVTSHGRLIGGFVSPEELERYERLKRREAEVLIVGSLPDDAVRAIRGARYGKSPR